MFQNNTRKNRVDPFRHGVLIGNYVEDLYGQDLAKKYYTNNDSETKNWKTESQNKFQWPNSNDQTVKKSEAILKINISNYDLNTDFAKKSINQPTTQNYNDQNYKLPEKNTIKDYKKTYSVDKTVASEGQRMLNKFHQQDCDGVFFTKKSGLVRDLFLGHGLDQHKFKDNEFSSTYK